MTTDSRVLLRLYMTNSPPATIKRILSKAPNPVVPYNPEPMEEALTCVVCYQVPRHYKWIRTCQNSHILCRDCLLYNGDKCAYCRSESVYFKQERIAKILENNAVGTQTCNWCPKQGTHGTVKRHEIIVHPNKLSYISNERPPRTRLSLNIDDWVNIIKCDFCTQILLPGETLVQCVEGHVICAKCKTSNSTCIIDQCDNVARSRPRTLEKVVEIVHTIQTISCNSEGCQFRSTILIVLAHGKICYNPRTHDLPFNDYRKEPNSTLEVIQYRRPNNANGDEQMPRLI